MSAEAAERPTRGEGHSLSPEEKILQNAEELTNPNAFALDPALMHLGRDHTLTDTGVVHSQADGTGNQNDEDIDSQAAENGDQVSDNGNKAAKKKAANAKSDELRRLWRENETVSLDTATQQLRRDLMTPQSSASDKSKHVLAMIWAKTFCRKRTNAKVARDVVYSHYEDTCSAAGVVPLNHANFGKCLSTVYPNIQIRRLGPRGESKYNYWGLELVSQQAQSAIGSGSRKIARSTRVPAGSSQVSAFMNGSKLPSETAVFPSYFPELDVPVITAPGVVVGTIALDLTLSNLGEIVAEDNLVHRPLFLPSSLDPGPRSKEDIQIVFPDIKPFLPEGVDFAVVDEFRSIYEYNCVSAVEHFLTLRTNLFYKFASFSSVLEDLPVPARQLINNLSLARWIEQSDKKMYMTMVQCLPPLIFDQIPEEALNVIKKMSKELVQIIAPRFASGQPLVYGIKVKLARLFAGILDRFVRVYNAIQGVTESLRNRVNRGNMYRDWASSVDIVRIVQDELPSCGYRQVADILAVEMRRLLEPFDEGEAGSGSDPADEPPIHTVLQRWGDFLMSLPQRFPHADTRRLITCTKLVSMGALKDIGANSCLTFPHWWTVKIWVDELVTFYAEAGGFTMDLLDLEDPDISPSNGGPAEATAALAGPTMSYPANEVDAPHDDSALGWDISEDEAPTTLNRRMGGDPKRAKG